MTTLDLRYPIGPAAPVLPATPEVRAAAIAAISALPTHLRSAVSGLGDDQLDTPYRPDGWTVRQVVHHVADSHMHGFLRVKLALTEDTPVVKPYEEKAWAALVDSRLPVPVSLGLLEGLHARWAAIYEAMTEAQFARTFVHPEIGPTPLSLDWHVQQYAWHSRHHVAHITTLRVRKGW